MSIWGVFGTQTVIMLAGLKNIPQHLYEAAKIDGANTLVQFRHVTVPMLTPTLFYTLIMAIIGAMQTFTAPLFIDTPQSAGIFMQVYIYLQAFTRKDGLCLGAVLGAAGDDPRPDAGGLSLVEPVGLL